MTYSSLLIIFFELEELVEEFEKEVDLQKKNPLKKVLKIDLPNSKRYSLVLLPLRVLQTTSATYSDLPIYIYIHI